jgi:hypothetical protein
MTNSFGASASTARSNTATQQVSFAVSINYSGKLLEFAYSASNTNTHSNTLVHVWFA